MRQIVGEASRALAHLDANRLEELALSCQALNRNLPTLTLRQRAQLFGQAKEIQHQMEIFSRVLDATRSNLHVVKRVEELRNRMEYSRTTQPEWPMLEKLNGND